MKQFRILNVLLGILILLAGWRLADVVQRAAPDVPADPSAGRVLTPAVPAPPLWSAQRQADAQPCTRATPCSAK